MNFILVAVQKHLRKMKEEEETNKNRNTPNKKHPTNKKHNSHEKKQTTKPETNQNKQPLLFLHAPKKLRSCVLCTMRCECHIAHSYSACKQSTTNATDVQLHVKPFLSDLSLSVKSKPVHITQIFSSRKNCIIGALLVQLGEG